MCFQENEFVHVHTPILTSSDCEGAGETFGITTGPQFNSTAVANVDSGSGVAYADLSGPSSADSATHPAHSVTSAPPSPPRPQIEPFFPRPVNLTVSSQLHLEAPTHSLSRTYTLSPCFRAERSLTSRHLSEFHMLEGEVVLDTLDELMDVVEDGIRGVLTRMIEGQGKRHQGCRRDLGRLLSEAEPATSEEGQGDQGRGRGDRWIQLKEMASRPFERITYASAIDQVAERHRHQPFDIEPKWEDGLASEHEKYLASQYGPTFITHYPKHLKPFYMLPSTADPSYAQANAKAEARAGAGSGLGRQGKEETVACFDLLFPHVGELAGGSMREHRLDHLERAIAAHGLDKDRYGWYLDLRRYGSVTHGGWGMGWDRWISWVTGVANLRDVVAFPRWKGHCDY